MQDSRLVPELIPICRDVLRSSKRDWLVRERSAICFLFHKATVFHLVSENTLQLNTLISEQRSY